MNTMEKDLMGQFALSAEEKLRQRVEGHREWLSQQDNGKCFDEQLHTSEGTQERIYWHYGYMVALRDALALLERQRAEQN